MSHGLDLALVDPESSLDDVLAVTCYAGISDMAVGRHLGVDVLHDGDRTHYGVTLVGCVICVYQVTLGIDEYCLCRGGACIDTEIERTLLFSQIEYRDLILCMSLVKGLLVSLIREDRIDPDDIRYKAFPVLELYAQIRQLGRSRAVSRERGTEADVDLGILRHPEGIDLLCKRSLESIAQL